MAFSTTMNNSSSKLNDQSVQRLPVFVINPKDWTKTECTRDRVVLVNANSDYSAPNQLRIERSRIANVYDGSGINTNYQLPSKRGVKLFMQCNSIATMVDSTNPTSRLELPYAASLTLRTPAVPTNIVSYSLVLSVLQQLIGVLCPNNSDSAIVPTTWANMVAKYLNGSIDFTTWG